MSGLARSLSRERATPDARERIPTMAGLEERPCKTEHLQIHGWSRQAIPEPSLRVYGADAPAIQEIARKEPALAEKLHPELRILGQRLSGLCAKRWRARSRMCFPEEPEPCCWVREPALKLPRE